MILKILTRLWIQGLTRKRKKLEYNPTCSDHNLRARERLSKIVDETARSKRLCWLSDFSTFGARGNYIVGYHIWRVVALLCKFSLFINVEKLRVETLHERPVRKVLKEGIFNKKYNIMK